VKYSVLLVLCSVAWSQQSSTSSRTYDLNGRPVPGVSASQSGGSRSQITRDVNGRSVPVESVDERVVSDSGGLKVIERTIKRYDANGSPGPAERVTIEERKQPDGSVQTSTTVSRGNLNGGFQLAERSTAITRTSGNRTETTTSIERPTLNGSLDVVEKSEQAITAAGAKTTENVTTLRRDANGRFAEAARKVREAVTADGQVKENIAEYETSPAGEARLVRQSTARIDPAGTREVTVYVPNTEGKLTLFKQQVIEKKDTGNGMVETTTVRFVLPSDPGKLGPARKAEEVVCSGDCGRKSTVAEVHQPAQTK
jgi:hypothetical protein